MRVELVVQEQHKMLNSRSEQLLITFGSRDDNVKLIICIILR